MSETIEAKCACGKTVKAQSRYAGMTGRCPSCHAQVKLPVPGFEDIEDIQPDQKTTFVAAKTVDPQAKVSGRLYIHKPEPMCFWVLKILGSCTYVLTVIFGFFVGGMIIHLMTTKAVNSTEFERNFSFHFHWFLFFLIMSASSYVTLNIARNIRAIRIHVTSLVKPSDNSV